MEIKEFYKKRIAGFHQLENGFREREKYFNISRLLVPICGAVIFYLLFPFSVWLATAAALVFIILFAILVKRDLENTRRIQLYASLKNINLQELECLNGQFNSFYPGTEYAAKEHPYSSDLDIFGPLSLFQFINRGVTKFGTDTLAGWLKKPAQSKEIKNRQDAVKELKDSIEFRHRISALGLKFNTSGNDVGQVIDWLYEPAFFLPQKKLMLFCTLMPVIMIAALVATFVFLPFVVVVLLAAVQVIVLWSSYRNVNRIHERISRSVGALKAYSQVLAIIEKEKFRSAHLTALKSELEIDGKAPSASIKYLAALLDRLDYRLNIFVGIFLNLFLMWDIHHIAALERWKLKQGEKVVSWFTVMGEIEALSGFANLAFNNPGWAFPGFDENYFVLKARNLGHPLIRCEARVCNDFGISGNAQMILVTGSNMSGKSTFLRTVGVNMVLALAGAPVCADEFVVTPVQVWTSMRIIDSLQENTSTFYAELKRLNDILHIVGTNEKILILLDEILKGTNSNDRHIGATALIKQLVREKAAGILATHDLALSDIEKELPGEIENYNFDVKIQGEELFFDYKIAQGVCKSLNASVLMKKMGINISGGL